MAVADAISRSPTLAPADTVMRRPSAGFWCTKPQSVRIRSGARPRHAKEVAVAAVAHVIFDAAGARQQPGGKAVQQGRLAGAGFADDGEHFARPEIEGDVAAADAVAVEFCNVMDFEKWSHFASSPL